MTHLVYIATWSETFPTRDRLIRTETKPFRFVQDATIWLALEWMDFATVHNNPKLFVGSILCVNTQNLNSYRIEWSPAVLNDWVL